MNQKPDGGPAFPGISHSYGENEIVDGHSQPYTGLSTYEGMTVRDWFAGQALSSIPLRDWSFLEDDGDAKIKAWAKAAYLTADAMLKEREKSLPSPTTQTTTPP